MRRRTTLLATVVTAAGLAAGAALASTGTAQAPGPPTGSKELVLRQASFKFVDHPPRRRGDGPPSPGDASIIGHQVLDRAGGERIGSMDIICVAADSRGRRMHCSGAVTLPDGSIMLEGAGGVVAITGGTGAYAGARGTAEGHNHDGQESLSLSFMP